MVMKWICMALIALLWLPSWSAAAVSLSERDWQTLKTIARNGVSGSGVLIQDSFPTSPTVGTLVVITDDTTTGACDSDAGSEVSLCMWDGTAWGSVSAASAVAPGLSDVAATDRTYGEAVSQATAIRFGSDAANAYIIIGYDTVGGLFVTCEIAGVKDDCDKAYKLLVGKKFQIINSSNVVVWEVDATGALTEGTIDASVAGVTVTLKEDRRRPVAACQNATAQAVWNLPTTNAPAPTCEGTNTRLATLDFDDSTDESYAGSLILPDGWASMTWYFRWKAAQTAGAVGWCVQLVRVPTGATSDPSLPAQAGGNCVSAAPAGTTLQEVSSSIANPTCTSCVAGDRVNFVVSRDANGGAVTDSMTGDAKLIMSGPVFVVNH